MVGSGGWLFSMPLYSGRGLFIVLFGAVTLGLVLAGSAVISRFQRWAIEYSKYQNASSTLHEKPDELSKPQIAEEESFEDFEFFEQEPLFEEKEEIIEKEMPA